MTTRDQEEQDLRIDQMAINIEKMRADMRWETWKFVISLVLASAALLGAGAAIGNYLANHPQSPPTPTQPMFPPGTVIMIPPVSTSPARP